MFKKQSIKSHPSCDYNEEKKIVCTHNRYILFILLSIHFLSSLRAHMFYFKGNHFSLVLSPCWDLIIQVDLNFTSLPKWLAQGGAGTPIRDHLLWLGEVWGCGIQNSASVFLPHWEGLELAKVTMWSLRMKQHSSRKNNVVERNLVPTWWFSSVCWVRPHLKLDLSAIPLLFSHLQGNTW